MLPIPYTIVSLTKTLEVANRIWSVMRRRKVN